MLTARRLSYDELMQIKNVIATLPRNKEVYAADCTGEGSVGEQVVAVLQERPELIKIHTVVDSAEVINQTRNSLVNASTMQKPLQRKWSGIQRDPALSAFRVDALLVSNLSNEQTLAVLNTWVPYMRMNNPVWIHDADEAVESYIHIRKLGRVGRGWACLVRE